MQLLEVKGPTMGSSGGASDIIYMHMSVCMSVAPYSRSFVGKGNSQTCGPLALLWGDDRHELLFILAL